jgi:hypothetical protein
MNGLIERAYSSLQNKRVRFGAGFDVLKLVDQVFLDDSAIKVQEA